MCRYKKWETINTFYAEANGGGDYIKIEPAKRGGMVNLEIGNCCVVTIKATVPVEFITAVLTQAAHKGLEESMKEAWPTPYGRLLAGMIEHL